MQEITIRLDDDLHRDLREKAEASGIGLSEMMRGILRDALERHERTHHLAGTVKLPAPEPGSWRAELRERNWRG
jgi:plasmid stability protein